MDRMDTDGREAEPGPDFFIRLYPDHLWLTPLWGVLHRPEQVPKLLVDVGGVGDGLGHFLAKNVPKAGAQAVDGDLDRAFGHAEPGGDVGVGVVALPGDVGRERVEQLALAAV